jgi:hypothetical protein
MSPEDQRMNDNVLPETVRIPFESERVAPGERLNYSPLKVIFAPKGYIRQGRLLYGTKRNGHRINITELS